MGHVAERVGRDLAGPEAPNSMDPRQCHERHADSGEGQRHGAASIPRLASQRVLVDRDVVLHGSGEPLPVVREVNQQLLTAGNPR